MNRREFLVNTGIIATALATASIPSETLAKPAIGSYIFNTQAQFNNILMKNGTTSNNQYFIMRNNLIDLNTRKHYEIADPNKPPNLEYSFEIIKVKPEDANLFVLNPDKHYIDNCPRFTFKEHFSWKTDWDNESDKKLIFGINVMMNKVAMNSRRGRGQNLILTSNTMKRIEPWKYIGFRTNSNFIIDENLVKDNEIFCFYKGFNPFDVAGILFDNGSVYLNRNHTDSLYSYGVLAAI